MTAMTCRDILLKVMCDVEERESTGDGRKFFHVLILMCDFRKLLVLLLLSKICLSVAFHSHTNTHTHTAIRSVETLQDLHFEVLEHPTI